MRTSEADKIFVFGASGHAKVVIDIIERQGAACIAFLVDDDPSLKGKQVYSYEVIGGKDDLMRLAGNNVRRGLVAIGQNNARLRVANWLVNNGFTLITAVHPSAQIARGVTLGPGTVVMAGAVINSDAQVGENAIINTRASVDHDCVIDDGVHIAPGTTLCGSVHVGRESFICAGATVAPNITIGERVTVGAGATVIDNVGDGLTVIGVPARPK